MKQNKMKLKSWDIFIKKHLTKDEIAQIKMRAKREANKLMEKELICGIDYEESSGNVYKDLGFDNPEEMMQKAELAYIINKNIAEKGFNINKAARFYGVSEQDIKDLSRGKFKSFTVDELKQMSQQYL